MERVFKNLISIVVCTSFLGACNVETAQVEQASKPQSQSVSLAPSRLAFPTPGTEISYNWDDRQRGNRPWRGVTTSGPFGEMRMSEHILPNRSLYPGCLLHCNRTSHPIDEENYLKLFPLTVGKTAEFERRRADGSSAWRHNVRVTGTQRIGTRLGEFDVFIIESRVAGINGNNYRGTTMSYWSPELAATVYEVHNAGNWRSELSIVQYNQP